MKKRTFPRMIALLSALILCASFAACSGDGKRGSAEEQRAVTVADTIAVGVVCAPFSDSFLKAKANPVYAQTPGEYAVAMLTAEPLMVKVNGKWTEKNGSIKTKIVDGKTVATVRLKSDLKSYNNQTPTMSGYTALIRQIDAYDYDGYFKDFYKNPIEGLVAFRFKRPGLTLADLPDFDAQTREKLAALLADEYKLLLIDTSIGGTFTGDLNEPSAYKTTFKNLLKRFDNSLTDEYFTKAGKKDLTEKIAAAYAACDRKDWIADLLFDHVKTGLMNAYLAVTPSKGDGEDDLPVKVEIGLKVVSEFVCEIRFEKIVSEEEAIEMLNLPICYSGASVRKGDFTYLNDAGTEEMRAISLRNKAGQRLTLVNVGADSAVDSIVLGQLRAAVFFDQPSDAIAARAKEQGLKCEKVGNGWAIYDPQTVDEAFLKSWAIFL